MRGSIRNNVGGKIADKLAWQKQYRFTIACENSSKPGYVTEKILDALYAGTIPIYWGASDVTNDFNPARFINCHDFSNLDEIVAEIKRIDSDIDECLGMISEPWQKPCQQQKMEDELKCFLFNIFDQGPVKAFRRTTYGVSHLHINSVRQAYDLLSNKSQYIHIQSTSIKDHLKILGRSLYKRIKERIKERTKYLLIKNFVINVLNKMKVLAKKRLNSGNA